MTDNKNMESWLREQGLGRFTEGLQDFGIETVQDLLDSDVVSDRELRSEIGMNQAEINKFRGAVNNNRTMDWSHIDAAKITKIQEAASKPKGFGEFCLFIRKLQRSMHFQRVDKMGKLHSCTIHMTEGNQGIVFEDKGVTTELLFEAMRGVHGFLHDETGEVGAERSTAVAGFCFLL